jgi:hypothetical protein
VAWFIFKLILDILNTDLIMVISIGKHDYFFQENRNEDGYKPNFLGF